MSYPRKRVSIYHFVWIPACLAARPLACAGMTNGLIRIAMMMNIKIRPKDLLKKALSPSAIMFFIIAASFIYILSATWFKWGELIIDTSRELLTPYQVLQGKIIYKDIFYPYGFFPPYFVSIIYRVFGISVGSLAFCGIAITILMSVLLYKIARFFLDEIFSSLTVLTFLFVFAFGFYTGNGIFNYILPYSFASTFFMLFTTFALYFFIKFLLTDNRRYGLCWCIAIVSSLLSRPDLSMLVWAGFFLAGAIRILGAKKRRALAEFLFLTAPVLIGAASYLFYIFMTNSWAGFNDSIISCIRINSTNKLTIAWAGLNDVVSNSLLMTGSFSVQLLIVSFLAFSAAAIRPPAREKETGSFRIMSQLLLVFVIFFLARAYVEAFSQYRCMPLLLLLGLAFSIVRMISSKDFKKDLALFTIFLIALLLTLRIFLNTTPYNYGFYLLNLSIVCYYIFFAAIFRDMLAERIRFDNNIYLPGLLMFFILLIIPHWQASLNMYANKNVVISTSRGAIGCFGSQRSIRFWSAVDYINKNTSGGDSVVVFPEGASLNFFTGRPCSSKYHTFLPPDVETVGEDKMLSEIANSNTDYIIILTRDTSEYGYTSFGFDYAKKLYAWIIDNYEVVKQFGPMPNTTNEFGIAILRAKGRAEKEIAP